MPDRLFEIVLAEIKKIPHVRIKSAHETRLPITLYGIFPFERAGQIVIDFERAVGINHPILEKILGTLSYQGEPLANIEDVRLQMFPVIGLPSASDEYYLMYLRPAFDRKRNRYERGRFELVVVGTLPFFGHPNENSPTNEYLMLKEYFPPDIVGIDSQLFQSLTSHPARQFQANLSRFV